MKYVAILLFLIIIIVTIGCPGIKVIAGNQHCFSCKGSCLQCITGYYGDYCNKKCHCSEGQQCDRESGTCTNEVTRYSVSNLNNWSYKSSDCNGTCEACIRGWHGEMCTIPCINCTIDGCNKTTGICKNCKHNFYGPNCDTPCPPHCHTVEDETSCHRESGSCYDGCEEGWQGDTYTQLWEWLLSYFILFPSYFAFFLIGIALGSCIESKFRLWSKKMKKICTENQDNTSTGESDQPFLN